MPSGCQFTESRVLILKQTLLHVMHGTLIQDKPTVSYAKVQTFLSCAANICNDRPLGVRLQSEDDFVPRQDKMSVCDPGDGWQRLESKGDK